MRTEIVTVPKPYMVKIPTELTERCRVSDSLDADSDNVITYGDVVSYSVELLGTVEECNEKLDAIRELQSRSN